MNKAVAADETVRRDIDGLRAIAVIIVLLFHAKLGDWSGGFVGVDVFFVVSGYLIIPQIAASLESGRFQLVDFFARRIRRLVPALAPVLVFTFIASVCLYGATGLAKFSDSLVGAAAFVSNYVFLAQSGYFQDSAEEVLLLHTWSLGVEFQFYVIMPLILLAVFRRISMVGVLAALGLASFVFSATLVSNGHGDHAFYGILPRFWELAVGGIVGLVRLPVPKTPLASISMRLAGLAAIISAALLFDTSMPFPGFAALLPVAGAALIIAAPMNTRDPVRSVLSSRIMNWIGLRSYSIYLWHWPLIVLVGLLTKPNDAKYAAAIVISFILADLSYRFIETPVRRLPAWRTSGRLLMLSLGPVAACGAMWLAVRTDTFSQAMTHLPGASSRYVREISQGARDEYMLTEHTSTLDGARISRGIQCSLDEPVTEADTIACLTRGGFAKPVLVIGDSHGRDTFHALRTGFPKTDFVLLNHSGCAPAEYVPYGTKSCFPRLLSMLDTLLQKTPLQAVVLTSQWAEGGVEAVGPTLDFLNERKLKTIVVGPSPTFGLSVPALLVRNGVTEGGPQARLMAGDFLFDVVKADRELQTKTEAAGLAYVQLLDTFCDAAGCRVFVPGKPDTLMIWDNQHLTVDAMLWLGGILAKDAQLSQAFGGPAGNAAGQ